MSKTGNIICVVLCSLLVGAFLFFGATPSGRGIWNQWFFRVQKADDATRYATRKTVEDTCRAMISSYTADKMTWLQYHDSDRQEHRAWADQAKMRANKTAASYNEYILKNSFVWENNIPADICTELEYLQ